MTANDILDTYDNRRAEILASRAAERDALLLDIDTASAALSALRGRLDALDTLTRLDIDEARAKVYGGLHVKLDADGCPVARQGKPTKAAQAARGTAGTEPPADPPTSTAPPETPTTGANAPLADEIADSKLDACASRPGADPGDGVDAFMAAVADSRTPGQVRLVLSDLDWAVDEMSQYSDTALAYAAKHGLKPSEVTRTDDGGMQIGVDGDVIP